MADQHDTIPSRAGDTQALALTAAHTRQQFLGALASAPALLALYLDALSAELALLVSIEADVATDTTPPAAVLEFPGGTVRLPTERP